MLMTTIRHNKKSTIIIVPLVKILVLVLPHEKKPALLAVGWKHEHVELNNVFIQFTPFLV